MFCMQSLRSCSEACEQKEGIISQLRSRGVHDCTNDWFITDISPRWGREVALANSYPKLFWVGSCATSLGTSSEHNPGSTRSLGNVAGGGRWSLLWTCNVTTGKKTKQKWALPLSLGRIRSHVLTIVIVKSCTQTCGWCWQPLFCALLPCGPEYLSTRLGSGSPIVAFYDIWFFDCSLSRMPAVW